MYGWQVSAQLRFSLHQVGEPAGSGEGVGASGSGGAPMGCGGDTALPAALSAALPHALKLLLVQLLLLFCCLGYRLFGKKILISHNAL